MPRFLQDGAYVQRFQLREVMETWLSHLSVERPSDPYQYIIDAAMGQRQSGGGIVTCSNQWCGMTMLASEYPVHAAMCERESNWSRCMGCNERVEKNKLEQHKQHCRLVACTHCGEVVLPRMLKLCPVRLMALAAMVSPASPGPIKSNAAVGAIRPTTEGESSRSVPQEVTDATQALDDGEHAVPHTKLEDSTQPVRSDARPPESPDGGSASPADHATVPLVSDNNGQSNDAKDTTAIVGLVRAMSHSSKFACDGDKTLPHDESASSTANLDTICLPSLQPSFHDFLFQVYPPQLEPKLAKLQGLLRTYMLFQNFRKVIFTNVWHYLDIASENKVSHLPADFSRIASNQNTEVRLQQGRRRSVIEKELSGSKEFPAAGEQGVPAALHLQVSETPDDSGAYISPSDLSGFIQFLSTGALIPFPVMAAIIRTATRILQSQRVVQRISIPMNGDVIVIGDLHGQMKDLSHIMHLIGGSPSSRRYLLFNGDFVDRGPFGSEVIVYIFALLCAYPHYVFLNRGNHEDWRTNTEYGFATELYGKYGSHSAQLHDLLVDSYQAMPLLSVVDNDILVVHGGVPRATCTLDELEGLGRVRDIPYEEQRNRAEQLLSDILWNDPVEKYRSRQLGRGHQGDHWRSSKRGCGVEYLEPLTEAFLSFNQLSMVIRSHEVVAGGFELMHKDKSVTVFSASNYSGVAGNRGAIAVLKKGAKQPVFHTWFLKDETHMAVGENAEEEDDEEHEIPDTEVLVGGDEFICAFYPVNGASGAVNRSSGAGGGSTTHLDGSLCDTSKGRSGHSPNSLPPPSDEDADRSGATQSTGSCHTKRISTDPDIMLQLNCIQDIREMVFMNRYALLAAFTEHDENLSGVLYKVVWSSIMQSVLNVDLPWNYLSQYLAPRLVVADIPCVEYVRFLNHFDASFAVEYRALWQMAAIRRIFGTVDLQEDLVRVFTDGAPAAVATAVSQGGPGTVAQDTGGRWSVVGGMMRDRSGIGRVGRSFVSNSFGVDGESTKGWPVGTTDSSPHYAGVRMSFDSQQLTGRLPTLSQLGNPTSGTAPPVTWWRQTIISFRTFAAKVRGLSSTVAVLEDSEIYTLFQFFDECMCGHVLLGDMVNRIDEVLSSDSCAEEVVEVLGSVDELLFAVPAGGATVPSPYPAAKPAGGDEVCRSPQAATPVQDSVSDLDAVRKAFAMTATQMQVNTSSETWGLLKMTVPSTAAVESTRTTKQSLTSKLLVSTGAFLKGKTGRQGLRGKFRSSPARLPLSRSSTPSGSSQSSAPCSHVRPKSDTLHSTSPSTSSFCSSSNKPIVPLEATASPVSFSWTSLRSAGGEVVVAAAAPPSISTVAPSPPIDNTWESEVLWLYPILIKLQRQLLDGGSVSRLRCLFRALNQSRDGRLTATEFSVLLRVLNHHLDRPLTPQQEAIIFACVRQHGMSYVRTLRNRFNGTGAQSTMDRSQMLCSFAIAQPSVVLGPRERQLWSFTDPDASNLVLQLNTTFMRDPGIWMARREANEKAYGQPYLRSSEFVAFFSIATQSSQELAPTESSVMPLGGVHEFVGANLVMPAGLTPASWHSVMGTTTISSGDNSTPHGRSIVGSRGIGRSGNRATLGEAVAQRSPRNKLRGQPSLSDPSLHLPPASTDHTSGATAITAGTSSTQAEVNPQTAGAGVFNLNSNMTASTLSRRSIGSMLGTNTSATRSPMPQFLLDTDATAQTRARAWPTEIRRSDDGVPALTSVLKNGARPSVRSRSPFALSRASRTYSGVAVSPVTEPQEFQRACVASVTDGGGRADDPYRRQGSVSCRAPYVLNQHPTRIPTVPPDGPGPHPADPRSIGIGRSRRLPSSPRAADSSTATAQSSFVENAVLATGQRCSGSPAAGAILVRQASATVLGPRSDSPGREVLVAQTAVPHERGAHSDMKDGRVQMTDIAQNTDHHGSVRPPRLAAAQCVSPVVGHFHAFDGMQPFVVADDDDLMSLSVDRPLPPSTVTRGEPTGKETSATTGHAAAEPLQFLPRVMPDKGRGALRSQGLGKPKLTSMCAQRVEVGGGVNLPKVAAGGAAPFNATRSACQSRPKRPGYPPGKRSHSSDTSLTVWEAEATDVTTGEDGDSRDHCPATRFPLSGLKIEEAMVSARQPSIIVTATSPACRVPHSTGTASPPTPHRDSSSPIMRCHTDELPLIVRGESSSSMHTAALSAPSSVER